MTMPRRLPKFIRDNQGGAAVEFVATMLFFIVIAFFVLEVGVAVFWISTAEKAAQIGVRLAIVRDPAVISAACPTGMDDGDPVLVGTLPLKNCRMPSAIYGTSCSEVGTCWDWDPIACVGGTGANCDAAGFATIATRVRAIFNLATDEKITVRYEDSGLGYAGGPVIPLVTVEISGVEYDLLFAGVLDRMRELAQRDGTTSAFTTMPTISVTLTGEDLSEVCC